MIVDGWIIPEDPSDVFAAGRQNAVDVLVGSNRDDLSFAPQNATPEQFEQRARTRWGDLADQFLSLYPHATDEEASSRRPIAPTTARSGTCGSSRTIKRSKAGRRVSSISRRTRPAPAGQPPFPAAHASEVPYVFNNLGQPALFPDRERSPELSAASAPDKKVADQMSSYWANFARTGNPNGPGLPTWQEHQVGASDRAIILDADPSSEKLPTKARLELYDKLYAQMRATRCAGSLRAQPRGGAQRLAHETTETTGAVVRIAARIFVRHGDFAVELQSRRIVVRARALVAELLAKMLLGDRLREAVLRMR